MRQGFTLVEMMVVIVIMAVLAAVVVPRLTGKTETAMASVARADIKVNIPIALKTYAFDNGHFPTTEEGLAALLVAPASASNWKGPYLDGKRLDPWGHDYRYRFPGVRRPEGYDLFCLGSDGVESRDDIANWQD